MLSSARCVVMHSCLAWYVLVHNSAKNGRISLQLGPFESSHWGEDRYAEFMFGLLVLTTKFSVIGAKSYSNWTLLQGHISVRSVKAHWRKALYLQIGKKEPGYYQIHYDMTIMLQRHRATEISPSCESWAEQLSSASSDLTTDPSTLCFLPPPLLDLSLFSPQLSVSWNNLCI